MAGGWEGHIAWSSRLNSPALRILHLLSVSPWLSLSLIHVSSPVSFPSELVFLLEVWLQFQPMPASLLPPMQTLKRPICTAFCLCLPEVSSPIFSWLGLPQIMAPRSSAPPSTQEGKFGKQWGSLAVPLKSGYSEANKDACTYTH